MSGHEILLSTVKYLSSKPESLRRDVDAFGRKRTDLSERDLAEAWCRRITKSFAAEGAATALPGTIPGPGTALQVGIESGAIAADVGFMLRCMGRMVGGVAHIYGYEINDAFTRDFGLVLGQWCGVLTTTKEASKRIATKVAVAQFKRVPGDVFMRINRRVGTTILTKYGTKRGGIAVGRLVPFGVGALVGGGFNWFTMSRFSKSTIKYFDEQLDLVEN